MEVGAEDRLDRVWHLWLVNALTWIGCIAALVRGERVIALAVLAAGGGLSRYLLWREQKRQGRRNLAGTGR
jgi:hypothetical protein